MSSARRYAPWMVVAFALIMLPGAFSQPQPSNDQVDWDALKSLPALEGGRIKPLDTVARNSLLVIEGKQTWKDAAGKRRPAIEWLAQALFAPEQSVKVPIFRVDNGEVVDLLEVQKEAKAKANGWGAAIKRLLAGQAAQNTFSLMQVMPHWDKISQAAQSVNPEAQLRTPYERAVLKLSNDLQLANGLTISAQPPPFLGQTPLDEFDSLQALVAQVKDPKSDEQKQMAPQAIDLMRNRYQQLAAEARLALIPPTPGQPDLANNWTNAGRALLETLDTGKVDPVLRDYGNMAEAWRAQDWQGFNNQLHALQTDIAARHPTPQHKVHAEVIFNETQPFIVAMVLYLVVFLAVCVSFMVWPRELQRGAYWVLLGAFAIHTLGIVARIWLQGRPPVTNLYSSAVFVGWVAVLASIFLERAYRIGVGSLVAALVGVPTLVIAHNLAAGGDTMEMMRAVLDSNFWLSTHVICVTVGYGATFLAGALAAVYIIGSLGRMDASNARAIERMMYGTVCFALLFSFVGTVLGGIWADQSWGRFWGWDPKENGALIIVLWNALVLHARWGRLVRPVGLAQLVVFGNIVTAWSWFGTNLLGVGLHSYGFTDKGFIALAGFMISQVVLIVVGFRARDAGTQKTLPREREPETVGQ